VREAVALGLNCVQFFTANHRQWKPNLLTKMDIAAWVAAIKDAGWINPDDHHVISHNSYLTNLASPDAMARKKSMFLQRGELVRCEKLKIRLCVIHPGAHLGAPRPTNQPNELKLAPTADECEGLKRLAKCLDELHKDLAGYRVITCLENTVGAGTTLGYRFDHLAMVRDMVKNPERVGYCIDTCHAVAAGYRMNTESTAKAVIQSIGAKLGDEHVKVFHLNDSLGECGSRRDRHTHIGDGNCGITAFAAILKHRAWDTVPMIMETPKEGVFKDRAWDLENAHRLRLILGAAAKKVMGAARKITPIICAAVLCGLLCGLPGCKTNTLEHIRGETEAVPKSSLLGPEKPSADETASLSNANDRADRGDYEAALILFKEILRDNPKLPDAWVGVGDMHTNLKEWQDAESAYANAVSLDSANFEANFGRGKALQVLNRLIDAIRSYHRALLVRPDDFDANLNMASAYLQLDEASSALTYAEKAVKLKPESGIARINLGVAYERAGRPVDAVLQYEMAAELMEPTPQLLMNLLNAYAQSKRYREAVNTATLLVRVAPAAVSWERLGWAYFRLGDYAKSLESYREAVRVDVKYWQGWNGVGVNLLNTWLQGGRKDGGAAEQARTAFRKSLQINPEQLKVQKLLTAYSL